MATNEELQQQLELLRQIAEKKIQISDLDGATRRSLARVSNLLLAQQSKLKQIVALREKQAAAAAKQKDTASQDAAAAYRNEADIARFILKKLQDRTTNYREYARAAKQLDSSVTKSQKKNLEDLAREYGKHRSQAARGFTDTVLGAGFTATATKAGKKAFIDQAREAQGSFVRGVGTLLLKGAGKLFGGMASFALDIVRQQARDAKNAVIKTMRDLDTEWHAYRESVGIHLGDGTYEAFLSAMDITTSMAKKFKDSDSLRFFGHVHVDTKDAQAALTAVTNGVSGFSALMRSSSRDTQAMGGLLVNQAAAFSRLGVKATATAKIYETAMKAQKLSGAEAAKMSRQIVSVAVALDKNINETVEDFNKMAPTLVQFGDQMTGVFARLEAQSKATGVAAGDLLDTAMRFDTFKGGAEAAGRLNAVLGQTAIDTMALIHAAPDEKINMLRKAIQTTLGPFNQLDRRTQSVIASVLGLKGGVQEAQKIFGQDTAYDEYAKKVTTGAEAEMLSAEKLEELMSSTANVNRMLRTAATSAASTINLATRGMQGAAKAVYWAGKTLGKITTFLTPSPRGILAPSPGRTPAGSPDVTPTVDPKKLARNQRLMEQARQEEARRRKLAQGSPQTTPRAPAPPPVATPEPLTAAQIKEMTKAAAAFRQSLAPIPASLNAVATSLTNLSKGSSGKALDKLIKLAQGGGKTVTVAGPAKAPIGTDIKEVSKIITAPLEGLKTLMQERGVKVGQDLTRAGDLDKAFSELNKISAKMSENLQAIPTQLSTAYREVAVEKRTLDTTTYLEKYTTIVKQQNTSQKDLADKIQKLVELFGDKKKGDQPLQITGPITLRIGTTEFKAAVEDAMTRIKSGVQ